MGTNEADEWTDDGHSALHPLSAAEHYANRLNRTRLYHCTIISFVRYCLYLRTSARMVSGFANKRSRGGAYGNH